MVTKKAAPFDKEEKKERGTRCGNCGSSSHATAGCNKKKKQFSFNRGLRYLWGHDDKSRRFEVFIETNYKALKKLKKLDRRMDEIMGVLDGLALALEDLQADSAAVVARVAEDFAFLKAQIAELTVRIDELVAGQIDPAQVEALQTLVGEIGVTVEGIEDIPNPVPEPEPEPLPEPEPEPVPVEEPPVV